MATDSPYIRVAARAIIVRDHKIILQHYEHEGFRWSCTPGGGINRGETLHEGLAREVHEELGIEIDIGPLVYVRELRAEKRDRIFGNLSKDFHQVEHFFVVNSFVGEPQPGTHSDDCAAEIEWVKLDQASLADANFYPLPLREKLPRDFAEGFTTGAYYLGDV